MPANITWHLCKHYSKISRKHYLYSLLQTSVCASARSCRAKFWFAGPVRVSISGNHGWCSDWVRLCWPRDGHLRSHTHAKSKLETLAFEWCKFYRSLCTTYAACNISSDRWDGCHCFDHVTRACRSAPAICHPLHTEGWTSKVQYIMYGIFTVWLLKSIPRCVVGDKWQVHFCKHVSRDRNSDSRPSGQS